MNKRVGFLLVCLTAVPAVAHACPVCFSADTRRSAAYVTVTLALLGLTFAIAITAGLWIWRLERRANARE